jgi:uncharacterized protein (TIGR00369 family)
MVFALKISKFTKLISIEMKKIRNPFVGLEGFDCFGCCPDNPIGLKMNFVEEDEYVTSEWEPSEHYQGYLNVLHGGIQATLMDEIASWTVYVKTRTAGVTSAIHSRFIKPVYINKGNIRLKCRLIKQEKKLATFEVQLFNSDNELCSESEIDYFIYPEQVARKRLYFPDMDSFYYGNEEPGKII